MSDNVIKVDFESESLKIADKRAQALHEWMVAQHGPVAVEAIKKQMARLKRMMPSPEDENEPDDPKRDCPWKCPGPENCLCVRISPHPRSP